MALGVNPLIRALGINCTLVYIDTREYRVLSFHNTKARILCREVGYKSLP